MIAHWQNKGPREKIYPSLDLELEYLIFKKTVEDDNGKLSEAERIIAHANKDRRERVKPEFQNKAPQRDVRIVEERLPNREFMVQELEIT